MYSDQKADYKMKARTALYASCLHKTFPLFPEIWVPKGPALLAAFLPDYRNVSTYLRKEQAALTSVLAFALDHQRKVV